MLRQEANSQNILNRVKQKAQERLNQKTDNTTDKALDKADPSNKTKSANTNSSTISSSNNTSGAIEATPATDKKTIAAYKNYDFIPGDKIIFQSQLEDETEGEIPSQLTLEKGQMDIQTEDGEKVVHVPKGPGASFTPRMANATSVPEQFTIEFDFKDETNGISGVSVNFGYRVGTYGPDDVMQGVGFQDVRANWKMGDAEYPEDLKAATKKPMEWHHFAIAINKNIGKAYIDQYRVVSLNNLTGNPKEIVFDLNGYENQYIKNIRIASGGIDLYKKITTDNKIITHGILFDVDKSAIQPSSMGTINKIFDILKKNDALKFEIDGHTDNSGSAAHNIALSKSRADAVKDQLVSMGVDASRLLTKGLGDTKPLGKNDTPEDKANNRRVEFVKM